MEICTEIYRKMIKNYKITMSSAEAKLVALGKLAMEMPGVRSMVHEWGVTEKDQGSQLLADVPAALSMAKRQGGGKMRDINVKSLWLQEKELQKELAYNNIKR